MPTSPKTKFKQEDPSAKYDDRTGTARRDEYQKIRPGEFDAQGKSISNNRPMGLTPIDAWNKAFGWQSGPQPSAPAQGPTPTGQTVDAPPVAPLSVPPGTLGAEWMAPAVQAGLQAHAASQQQPTAAPAPNTTRQGANGQSETFTPTSTGGRWVPSSGGVAVPAANNLTPGQANTASLANHRVVAYPQRLFNRDASGMTQATPEQIERGTDYISGKNGVVISETDPSGHRVDNDPAYAPLDSAAVQGALNDAVPGAPQARAATADVGAAGQGGVSTPYGPVSVTQDPAGRPAPAAGRNGSIPPIAAAAPPPGPKSADEAVAAFRKGTQPATPAPPVVPPGTLGGEWMQTALAAAQQANQAQPPAPAPAPAPYSGEAAAQVVGQAAGAAGKAALGYVARNTFPGNLAPVPEPPRTVTPDPSAARSPLAGDTYTEQDRKRQFLQQRAPQAQRPAGQSTSAGVIMPARPAAAPAPRPAMNAPKAPGGMPADAAKASAALSKIIPRGQEPYNPFASALPRLAAMRKVRRPDLVQTRGWA